MGHRHPLTGFVSQRVALVNLLRRREIALDLEIMVESRQPVVYKIPVAVVWPKALGLVFSSYPANIKENCKPGFSTSTEAAPGISSFNCSH